MTKVGSEATPIRRVCERWQQRVLETVTTPEGRTDVVGDRLTFSCVCGGDGCPDDPRRADPLAGLLDVPVSFDPRRSS